MRVQFERYNPSDRPAVIIEAETDVERLALAAVMGGQVRWSAATVQPWMNAGAYSDSNGPGKLVFSVGAELPPEGR